jgi:hypothetical protein
VLPSRAYGTTGLDPGSNAEPCRRSVMSMRLSLLKFLLPLLLLFSQQDALVHELSHIGEELAQLQSPSKQVPDSKPCAKCIVFAHIAGAVHSEAPQLPAQNLAYAQPGQAQVASFAAETPSPRSRGPPLFL